MLKVMMFMKTQLGWIRPDDKDDADDEDSWVESGLIIMMKTLLSWIRPDGEDDDDEDCGCDL